MLPTRPGSGSRLCLLLEGTAATIPLWREIREVYIDPLLRAIESCQLGNFELCLVVFHTTPGYSCAVVDWSPWTADVHEFRQLLNSFQPTGGGTSPVCLSEALVEALYMFSLDTCLDCPLHTMSKHAMLCCVSKPHPRRVKLAGRSHRVNYAELVAAFPSRGGDLSVLTWKRSKCCRWLLPLFSTCVLNQVQSGEKGGAAQVQSKNHGGTMQIKREYHDGAAQVQSWDKGGWTQGPADKHGAGCGTTAADTTQAGPQGPRSDCQMKINQLQKDLLQRCVRFTGRGVMVAISPCWPEAIPPLLQQQWQHLHVAGQGRGGDSSTLILHAPHGESGIELASSAASSRAAICPEGEHMDVDTPPTTTTLAADAGSATLHPAAPRPLQHHPATAQGMAEIIHINHGPLPARFCCLNSSAQQCPAADPRCLSCQWLSHDLPPPQLPAPQHALPQQHSMQAPAQHAFLQQYSMQAPAQHAFPQQHSMQTPVQHAFLQQHNMQAPAQHAFSQQHSMQAPVQYAFPQQHSMQAPVAHASSQQHSVQVPPQLARPPQPSTRTPRHIARNHSVAATRVHHTPVPPTHHNVMLRRNASGLGSPGRQPMVMIPTPQTTPTPQPPVPPVTSTAQICRKTSAHAPHDQQQLCAEPTWLRNATQATAPPVQHASLVLRQMQQPGAPGADQEGWYCHRLMPPGVRLSAGMPPRAPGLLQPSASGCVRMQQVVHQCNKQVEAADWPAFEGGMPQETKAAWAAPLGDGVSNTNTTEQSGMVPEGSPIALHPPDSLAKPGRRRASIRAAASIRVKSMLATAGASGLALNGTLVGDNTSGGGNAASTDGRSSQGASNNAMSAAAQHAARQGQQFTSIGPQGPMAICTSGQQPTSAALQAQPFAAIGPPGQATANWVSQPQPATCAAPTTQQPGISVLQGHGPWSMTGATQAHTQHTAQVKQPTTAAQEHPRHPMTMTQAGQHMATLHTQHPAQMKPAVLMPAHHTQQDMTAGPQGGGHMGTAPAVQQHLSMPGPHVQHPVQVNHHVVMTTYHAPHAVGLAPPGPQASPAVHPTIMLPPPGPAQLTGSGHARQIVHQHHQLARAAGWPESCSRHGTMIGTSGTAAQGATSNPGQYGIEATCYTGHQDVGAGAASGTRNLAARGCEHNIGSSGRGVVSMDHAGAAGLRDVRYMDNDTSRTANRGPPQGNTGKGGGASDDGGPVPVSTSTTLTHGDGVPSQIGMGRAGVAGHGDSSQTGVPVPINICISSDAEHSQADISHSGIPAFNSRIRCEGQRSSATIRQSAIPGQEGCAQRSSGYPAACASGNHLHTNSGTTNTPGAAGQSHMSDHSGAAGNGGCRRSNVGHKNGPSGTSPYRTSNGTTGAAGTAALPISVSQTAGGSSQTNVAITHGDIAISHPPRTTSLYQTNVGPQRRMSTTSPAKTVDKAGLGESSSRGKACAAGPAGPEGTNIHPGMVVGSINTAASAVLGNGHTCATGGSACRLASMESAPCAAGGSDHTGMPCGVDNTAVASVQVAGTIAPNAAVGTQLTSGNCTATLPQQQRSGTSQRPSGHKQEPPRCGGGVYKTETGRKRTMEQETSGRKARIVEIGHQGTRTMMATLSDATFDTLAQTAKAIRAACMLPQGSTACLTSHNSVPVVENAWLVAHESMPNAGRSAAMVDQVQQQGGGHQMPASWPALQIPCATSKEGGWNENPVPGQMQPASWTKLTQPIPGPMQTLPASGTMQKLPASGPMQTQPAAGLMQTQSASGPMQTQPASGPMQTQPASGPTQTQPASGPLQTQPAPGPMQTQPASGPMQTQPASGPMQTQPKLGQLSTLTGSGQVPREGSGWVPVPTHLAQRPPLIGSATAQTHVTQPMQLPMACSLPPSSTLQDQQRATQQLPPRFPAAGGGAGAQRPTGRLPELLREMQPGTQQWQPAPHAQERWWRGRVHMLGSMLYIPKERYNYLPVFDAAILLPAEGPHAATRQAWPADLLVNRLLHASDLSKQFGPGCQAHMGLKVMVERIPQDCATFLANMMTSDMMMACEVPDGLLCIAFTPPPHLNQPYLPFHITAHLARRS